MGSGMAEKLRAWPAAAAILLFIVTANLCPAGRGLSLPIEMAPGCRLGRRRQLQSLELDHLAKMNQLIHAGDSHQPASSSTGAGAAAEAAGLSVPLDMYGQVNSHEPLRSLPSPLMPQTALATHLGDGRMVHRPTCTSSESTSHGSATNQPRPPD